MNVGRETTERYHGFIGRVPNLSYAVVPRSRAITVGHVLPLAGVRMVTPVVFWDTHIHYQKHIN